MAQWMMRLLPKHKDKDLVSTRACNLRACLLCKWLLILYFIPMTTDMHDRLCCWLQKNVQFEKGVKSSLWLRAHSIHLLCSGGGLLPPTKSLSSIHATQLLLAKFGVIPPHLWLFGVDTFSIFSTFPQYVLDIVIVLLLSTGYLHALLIEKLH